MLQHSSHASRRHFRVAASEAWAPHSDRTSRRRVDGVGGRTAASRVAAALPRDEAAAAFQSVLAMEQVQSVIGY